MKKNGFTLVELLAVILIIGILSLITIPAVDSVIKSSRKSAHEKQVKLILTAAKDWGAKHIMSLPTVDGDTVSVTVGTLKTSGLLEVELRSPLNDLCFSNNTEIIITRENNNYTYSFANDEFEYEDNCEVLDGD